MYLKINCDFTAEGELKESISVQPCCVLALLPFQFYRHTAYNSSVVIGYGGESLADSCN